MSDNLRTALYGAEYTCAGITRVGADTVLSRVVGKHCESGDIVVRDAWLPDDLEAGDLLRSREPGPTADRWPPSTPTFPGRP